MMSGRIFWAGLIVVLLLATGLRIYRLDHQSFWNDEGNTARLSERSPQLIIEGTAADVHPPLYYLLLAGWRSGVGESEFSLRYFSVAAGLLISAVVIGGTAIFYDRPTALVAGLLAGLLPPLVYYAQEARMYSVLGLWSVLATSLFIWGLERDDWSLAGGRIFSLIKKRWVIGYVFACAAGLYTHYSFPAVLVAHAIGFGIWLLWGPAPVKKAPVILSGLVIAGLIGLLYAPWLPIFLNATGRAAAPQFDPPFWGRALGWLWVGPTGQLPVWGGLVVALVVLAGAWWRPSGGPFHQEKVRIAIYWLLAALVPIGVMTLTGATATTFLKFLTVGAPGIAVLAAAGVVAIGRKVARQPAGAMVAVGVLLLLIWPLGQSLNRLYFDPATYRADYRALAAQIAADGYPQAAILLNAPNQWEVFTYYYDGPAAVYPFPRFVMPAAEVISEMDEIGRRHERVYGIFWGADGFDPDGVVERWLTENGYKVIDEFRGDLRYVVVALPSEAGLPPPQSLNLAVGPHIILRSAAVSDSQVRPGEVITAALTWESGSAIDRRYKVFLHLVNEKGELVAQRDSEPDGNRRPTTDWAVGEPVEDRHGILVPPEAPPGQYSLLVGMYDPARPADRLPIRPLSTDEPGRGSWLLETITVEPDP